MFELQIHNQERDLPNWTDAKYFEFSAGLYSHYDTHTWDTYTDRENIIGNV